MHHGTVMQQTLFRTVSTSAHRHMHMDMKARTSSGPSTATAPEYVNHLRSSPQFQRGAAASSPLSQALVAALV